MRCARVDSHHIAATHLFPFPASGLGIRAQMTEAGSSDHSIQSSGFLTASLSLDHLRDRGPILPAQAFAQITARTGGVKHRRPAGEWQDPEAQFGFGSVFDGGFVC
jgi:hypothetical protein